jgi:hypothetical protein
VVEFIDGAIRNKALVSFQIEHDIPNNLIASFGTPSLTPISFSSANQGNIVGFQYVKNSVGFQRLIFTFSNCGIDMDNL